MKTKYKHASGFSITELIIVIVIIAILATISIVAYMGVTNNAKISSLKNDLTNAKQQLYLYKLDQHVYPSSLDGNYCPFAPTPDTELCLKLSGDNRVVSYVGDNSGFTLIMRNGSVYYQIINDMSPSEYITNTLAKAYGTTSGDWVESMIKTNDGGIATVGSTNINANTDAFLAKYDSNGQLDWSRTWNNTSTDYGYSIIQTTDEGFVIVGSSYNSGNIDAFIAKYTSEGELSWSRSWGETGDDYARSMV